MESAFGARRHVLGSATSPSFTVIAEIDFKATNPESLCQDFPYDEKQV